MTQDFDVKITETLSDDESIVSMLGDGKNSIYNTFCDFKGKFPLIIFRKTGAFPQLSYDNRCHGQEVDYAVVVCTKDKELPALEKAVILAMEDADFNWTGTDMEFSPDYKEFYAIINFNIGEEF